MEEKKMGGKEDGNERVEATPRLSPLLAALWLGVIRVGGVPACAAIE
jgi:hypothetical protein